MKKEFLNIEVINVSSAVNQLLQNEDKVKALPIKFRWALKKNMTKFVDTVKNFEDFRDELIEELQKDYFNDEKSYQVTNEKEDGSVETGLQIKEEYLDEYQKRVDELNEKLRDVLNERNVYEINTVDLDSFVDNLPEDTALEFEDIEILSFMEG